MTRFAIPDFQLANRIYVGARVHVYGIDDDGEIDEDNLVTLYEGLTGAGTLRNPQKLDSDGKFAAPVYVDEPVVCLVSGLSIADHRTGVIRSIAGTPSVSGALVGLSADVTAPTYPYAVAFNVETRDTDAIHSGGSPSKLTVPAGFANARLKGQVTWTSTVAGDSGVAATIYKNGSAVYAGVPRKTQGKSYYGNPSIQLESPILDVSPGDYFELVADTSDAASNIDDAGTWFEMELL